MQIIPELPPTAQILAIFTVIAILFIVGEIVKAIRGNK